MFQRIIERVCQKHTPIVIEFIISVDIVQIDRLPARILLCEQLVKRTRPAMADIVDGCSRVVGLRLLLKFGVLTSVLCQNPLLLRWSNAIVLEAIVDKSAI